MSVGKLKVYKIKCFSLSYNDAIYKGDL